MARRDLVALSSVGVWGLSTANRFAESLDTAPRDGAVRRRTILGARLDKPIRYPNCTGDVWTTAWADDANLYSVSDDTTDLTRPATAI